MRAADMSTGIDGVYQCRHYYQHVRFLVPYFIMIMYFHNYYCYQLEISQCYYGWFFGAICIHIVVFAILCYHSTMFHYIHNCMRDHTHLPICHRHTGQLISTNLCSGFEGTFEVAGSREIVSSLCHFACGCFAPFHLFKYLERINVIWPRLQHGKRRRTENRYIETDLTDDK